MGSGATIQGEDGGWGLALFTKTPTQHNKNPLSPIKSVLLDPSVFQEALGSKTCLRWQKGFNLGEQFPVNYLGSPSATPGYFCPGHTRAHRARGPSKTEVDMEGRGSA